jgi:diguanylate cyclase (GGDEF)-like protein
MQLDVQTLLIVNAANVLVLAMTLPRIMGQALSPAASAARMALVVQAIGWTALIASGFWPEQWPDRLLSTISMGCLGWSHWLMYTALEGWLGPRPLKRSLLAIVILLPLGYGVMFSSYPLRVGWANFLLAAQMLILARSTLLSATELRGPWRLVMSGCMLTMAVMTSGRGVMGAFMTELYPTFVTPHPFNVLAMLAANIALVVLNVAILVAWREEAELQLRLQAMTDSLTGLLNRRGWYESAAASLTPAQRHNLPCTLLTLDLDHFKQVNDSHGHEVGDRALRLFGAILSQGKRSGDVIARVGGEEFFMLLPMTNETAARGLDLRLRSALQARAQGELGFALDFSTGLAIGSPGAESLDQVMARADAALYRAKAEGRGRLVAGTADA